MARLAFLFTLTFLLFTFSHARFITSESQHDIIPKKSVTDLPESDPESAILLPSEKPHFEPPKLLDFKHDDDASGVASVPLTKISFNPVNRHFPRRPLIPFRHKHNCRFHKRFRPLNPRFHQKRFISYGNDMILSDERSFEPESRGVVRQIEARWGSFDDDGTESKHHEGFMKPDHHDHEHHDEDHDHEHHDEDHDHEHHDEDHDHEHRDEDHDHEHHDEEDHEEEHHHHHHHHHHRHHHHGEEERDESEEHEGGFMEKFRKYFIHF